MRTLLYAQFAQILNLSLIIKLEVLIIAGLRRTETTMETQLRRVHNINLGVGLFRGEHSPKSFGAQTLCVTHSLLITLGRFFAVRSIWSPARGSDVCWQGLYVWPHFAGLMRKVQFRAEYS